MHLNLNNDLDPIHLYINIYSDESFIFVWYYFSKFHFIFSNNRSSGCCCCSRKRVVQTDFKGVLLLYTELQRILFQIGENLLASKALLTVTNRFSLIFKL